MTITAINDFTIEQHEGPYVDWSSRSRLYYKGEACDCYVPGYVLEAQYKIIDGYILVISYDCPFEESNKILFLNDVLIIKAKTTIEGELLYAHWSCDDDKIVLHFYGNNFYILSISYKKFLFFEWPIFKVKSYDYEEDAMSKQSALLLEKRLSDINNSLNM
jgi:hypothetical protein